MASAAQDPEPDAVQTTATVQGITTITINRPQRRNAVDTPTAHKLYAAFLAFENNPSQKVCILTGAKGTFCAGFDLHTIPPQRSSSPPEPAEQVRGRNRGPMGPSRLRVSKPVIAAVAGHAVAGGLELSLLADMRVAEEDAIFGVFCRRFGVPLIDGGTVRLQKIVGLGRALDMILTGRPVGAEEALAMGLANRLVPKGKALETATELAKSLLAFPQDCMNGDRRSAYYAAHGATSFEDAMRNEFQDGSKVITNEAV